MGSAKYIGSGAGGHGAGQSEQTVNDRNARWEAMLLKLEEVRFSITSCGAGERSANGGPGVRAHLLQFNLTVSGGATMRPSPRQRRGRASSSCSARQVTSLPAAAVLPGECAQEVRSLV